MTRTQPAYTHWYTRGPTGKNDKGCGTRSNPGPVEEGDVSQTDWSHDKRHDKQHSTLVVPSHPAQAEQPHDAGQRPSCEGGQQQRDGECKVGPEDVLLVRRRAGARPERRGRRRVGADGLEDDVGEVYDAGVAVLQIPRYRRAGRRRNRPRSWKYKTTMRSRKGQLLVCLLGQRRARAAQKHDDEDAEAGHGTVLGTAKGGDHLGHDPHRGRRAQPR